MNLIAQKGYQPRSSSVAAMKQFWRRPFQFWNDFKRAVEAKQVPEPAWYRTVLKNPPGQYNTKGERPWPKLSFPLDNYRKLYYQDYPNEALQYGHSALPGETRYRISPMEIFLERHSELTSGGLDPDLAYLQCQEEKASREFTQHLERFFCAQQAMNFYGVEPEEVSADSGPSAYERARALVLKDRRQRLAAIVRMKRDVAGDEARVTRADLEGISDEELFEFIRLHPGDAPYFDHTVFYTEEDALDETDLPVPMTFENANDQAVHSYFGVGDYWDSSKFTDKEVTQFTNRDFEELQADTVKMIDHLSDELGVGPEAETMYDSLSDAGRYEVIAAWSQTFPDSLPMLGNDFHATRMSKDVHDYNKAVTEAGSTARTSPSEARRREPGFTSGEVNKAFGEFNKTSADVRAKRAKRVDPLKTATLKSRTGSL